jgi:catechol 2,3-dioxygenase-like lactoylglutathione lyase family enzyme
LNGANQFLDEAVSIMFTLQQIDHVALTVSDLEKSIAWYQEVLGLERRYQEAWGDCPAMLRVGSTCVALFPLRSAESPAPTNASAQPAMQHLAFRTTYADLLEAEKNLKERSIPFEFQDHGTAHSIYFADPDGHQLEITTYDLPKPEKPFLA